MVLYGGGDECRDEDEWVGFLRNNTKTTFSPLAHCNFISLSLRSHRQLNSLSHSLSQNDFTSTCRLHTQITSWPTSGKINIFKLYGAMGYEFLPWDLRTSTHALNKMVSCRNNSQNELAAKKPINNTL